MGLLTEIANMINAIPKDGYNYGNEVAKQILSKILEAVDGAAIDHPVWYKDAREYEAYCAGKNDKLQAIKKQFEDTK